MAVEFEEVTRVSGNQSSDQFSYTDTDAGDNVVYYRLHQRFENGGEQIAGALKLGLGSQETVQDVILLGNHPNPFNPSTTISYEVKEELHIEIVVLDLSGHLISVLADRQHEPGVHQVDFDGSDYTSGMYIVRLISSSGEIQTRQIVLTK